MEQKNKEEFQRILEDYIELEYDDILLAMQRAYDLGKSSKKCKEDKDNPYHIDEKRQTKIEF